jgi:hypothetical protein
LRWLLVVSLRTGVTAPHNKHRQTNANQDVVAWRTLISLEASSASPSSSSLAVIAIGNQKRALNKSARLSDQTLCIPDEVVVVDDDNDTDFDDDDLFFFFKKKLKKSHRIHRKKKYK